MQHSNLLNPIVSFEENQVLLIRSLNCCLCEHGITISKKENLTNVFLMKSDGATAAFKLQWIESQIAGNKRKTLGWN
jgi:hypothetical protein